MFYWSIKYKPCFLCFFVPKSMFLQLWRRRSSAIAEGPRNALCRLKIINWIMNKKENVYGQRRGLLRRRRDCFLSPCRWTYVVVVRPTTILPRPTTGQWRIQGHTHTQFVQFPVSRRLPRDWVTDWYLGQGGRSTFWYFASELAATAVGIRRLGTAVQWFVTTLSNEAPLWVAARLSVCAARTCRINFRRNVPLNCRSGCKAVPMNVRV